MVDGADVPEFSVTTACKILLRSDRTLAPDALATL